MKRKILHKKLAITYPNSTVYNWLNGNRKPSYEVMLKLHDEHQIPFSAWQDIKSYLQDNDNTSVTNTSTTNPKEKVIA